MKKWNKHQVRKVDCGMQVELIGKPGRNVGRRKNGSRHRINRSGEWKFCLIKINMSRSVDTIVC